MHRIIIWLAVGSLLLLTSNNMTSAQRNNVRRTVPPPTSYDAGLPAGPPPRYTAGDMFQGVPFGGSPGPLTGDAPLDAGPGLDEDIAYQDGCSDGLCGAPLCDSCDGSMISAGVEFTFLKPHFESNLAFSTLQSDGATFENFSDTEFDYETQLAPRVWVEILQMGTLGFRASYWQFDHSSRVATGSPPSNGFGRISPPSFGDVDLSTSTPGSVFTAQSALNAYNIDLEGTKSFDCGLWGWMATGGLRYAESEQSYNGVLVNADGDTQGTVNFRNRIQGIGPTISIRTQRPFTSQLSLFGFARGALLFGDGVSALDSVEDQDLDNQLTTQSLSERDDLLPVGEMQVGFQWTPPTCGAWYPYVHVAMEGQLWNGAGNASSESGNLGFYGLNVALGMDW